MRDHHVMGDTGPALGPHSSLGPLLTRGGRDMHLLSEAPAIFPTIVQQVRQHEACTLITIEYNVKRTGHPFWHTFGLYSGMSYVLTVHRRHAVN